MEIDPKDVITATQSQRNGALDENAHLFALLQAAQREIAELKAKYEPSTKTDS